MSKGLPVVISGPSGVGKGTIVEELLRRDNIALSISATTRQPRPGESDGVHYYFITKEEFEYRIMHGDILEYTVYNGNYYGTPKSKVEEACARGADIILEIETEGAMQIKKKYPEALLIFITAPMEEIERRLHKRGTEDEQTIVRRLEIARHEMSLASQYDKTVENDSPAIAADEIIDIISKEKEKRCS